MKKKLITALVLTASAILLVCASVLGTMAFLMSSFVVTNTFTVGEVGIEMYESKTNDSGQYVDADGNVAGTSYLVNGKKTADANTYKLVPNKTYIKDPTIYVKAGSVESYLFVKVKNDIASIECNNVEHTEHLTIAHQLQNNGWQLIKENNETNEKLYLYVGESNATDKIPGTDGAALPSAIVPKLAGGNNAEQYDLFSNFTVSNDCGDVLPKYGAAKIILTAFAIQADDFNEENNGLAPYQNAWNTIIDKSSYVGTKFPAVANN